MQQLIIFDSPLNDEQLITTQLNTLNDIDKLETKIKGLIYIPEYITKAEQAFFWQSVNNENWLGDLKRRVQHYGYKYDYKARFINYSMKIGDLPGWAYPFAKRLGSTLEIG